MEKVGFFYTLQCQGKVHILIISTPMTDTFGAETEILTFYPLWQGFMTCQLWLKSFTCSSGLFFKQCDVLTKCFDSSTVFYRLYLKSRLLSCAHVAFPIIIFLSKRWCPIVWHSILHFLSIIPCFQEATERYHC